MGVLQMILLPDMGSGELMDRLEPMLLKGTPRVTISSGVRCDASS
jgi:hypothetical protein